MSGKCAGPIAAFSMMIFSAIIVSSHPAQSQAAARKIPNQYICAFNSQVTKAHVQAEAHRAINPESGWLLRIYRNTIRGFAVRLPATLDGPAKAVARLKKHNPNIAYCEQDGVSRAIVAPQAGKPGGGGGGSKQKTPWGVARVGGAGDGTGKTAWIIDSGVDLDHPDLNVDPARGWDYIDNDAVPDDANGHGTHVAGIIAARNNAIGVVGVAAGATVVAMRVLDAAGSGPDSGVIAAIDDVAGRAAAGDVVNLSLAADSCATAMNAAIYRATFIGGDPNQALNGVRYVIAAGNSGNYAENYCPGSTDGANIYTVSASDTTDALASFSNWGNPPVDFAEPGVGILSTYKGGRYTTLSGTSMAAPHLAGILLLGSVKNGGVVKGDIKGDTTINPPDIIGQWR